MRLGLGLKILNFGDVGERDAYMGAEGCPATRSQGQGPGPNW